MSCEASGGFDSRSTLLGQHFLADEQWDLWDATLPTNPHTAAWWSRMQSCELAGTFRWSAVLSQEGLQITPASALAPSEPQRPRPSTFCFVISFGAGGNDQADWMSVLPDVKVEQFSDAPSQLLGLVGPPQLYIKLIHRSQVSIKLEFVPRRKALLFQIFEVEKFPVEHSVWPGAFFPGCIFKSVSQSRSDLTQVHFI